MDEVPMGFGLRGGPRGVRRRSLRPGVPSGRRRLPTPGHVQMGVRLLRVESVSVHDSSRRVVTGAPADEVGTPPGVGRPRGLTGTPPAGVGPGRSAVRVATRTVHADTGARLLHCRPPCHPTRGDVLYLEGEDRRCPRRLRPETRRSPSVST